MLLAVLRRAIAMGKRDVHKTFFMAGTGGSGKACDADRQVRLAALQRALGHRASDNFGHGFVLLEQLWLNAQQLGLGVFAVSDESAIEAMARPFDVGEERGEHSAGAAFRRR